MKLSIPCLGDRGKRKLFGRLFFVPLILLLAGSICSGTSHASEDADELPTVFLFLLDRVGLKDITGGELPTVRRLAEWGGAGLLNARTGGGRGSGASYATLGSGERAVGGTASGLAFNRDEVYAGQSVIHLYEALHGEAVGDAAIVHLGAAELQGLGAMQERPFSPGRLGEALRLARVPVAVYGNADTPVLPQRFGALVAMDRSGRIPAGNVGPDTLVDDPTWPFGLRTDYDELLELVLRHVDQPGLVVVDLADLARLEAVELPFTAEQFAAHRKAALGRMDAFVAAVMAALQEAATDHDVLIVVPQPPAADVSAGYLLTPAVWAHFPGAGGASGTTASGLLTSPTTRRTGLAANTDIAPTVLHWFGVEEPGWVGRTLSVVPTADVWSRLDALYDQITRIHKQRLPVIQPYFFVQLAAVLLSTAVLVFHNKLSRYLGAIARGARWLHLALVAFPLALLLLPLLPPADSLLLVWGQIAGIALGLALAAHVAGGRNDPIFAFTLLCTATAAALCLDTAAGATLIQRSHLGYDPIGGSRYYGIGNEYMGVLIGTAAIAAGGWLDKARRQGEAHVRRGPLWLVGICFAAIVFIFASPVHGVNFGGTIAATVGFGALAALFAHRRISWRSAGLTLAVLIGVIGLASLYDLGALNEAHSHVGGAIQQVSRSGADPLWTIFERKLAVNVRLIRLTIWSRAFFISLIAAVGLMIYPPRLMRRLLHTHRYLGLAIRGSLIAAVTALLVNDSGIVAAATLMIPVVSTLLYLMLEKAVYTEGGDDGRVFEN